MWDILSNIKNIVIGEQKESNGSFKKYKNIVIDESEGPVIIQDNVVIEPFAYLKGPLIIDVGSKILSHSRIQNSIIGPGCKIGGEVSGTIFQGWSNKGHYGFLGDSFVGEWVNFGAGATNSNLKNNYKSVLVNDKHKHNATRSFQALRIFINKELDVLKDVLEKSFDVLAPKGRLVLITYHSLEERVIKDFLIYTDHYLSAPRKMPIKRDFMNKMFNLIKKIKPSDEEIEINPRSRSAKINVLEKQS